MNKRGVGRKGREEDGIKEFRKIEKGISQRMGGGGSKEGCNYGCRIFFLLCR